MFVLQVFLNIFDKKKMNIEKQITLSKTTQVKIVFKSLVNDHNTLFGGIALQWMDEVAYITATRFCRKKVVTISTGKINFQKPIPYGTIAELVGTVENIGSVKLEINVKIFIEQKYSENREIAVEGNFYFAAVDVNNKPIRLLLDN